MGVLDGSLIPLFLFTTSLLQIAAGQQTTSTALPSGRPTNNPDDYGGYAPSDGPSFGTYGYFLIGLFIVTLVLSYWLIVRRRRRALEQLRPLGYANNSHGRHDSHHRNIMLRRFNPVNRRDEGLDERGEAPPPYAAGYYTPGPSVQVPLNFSSKPPEYGSQDDLADLTRPAPTHRPGVRATGTNSDGDSGPASRN